MCGDSSGGSGSDGGDDGGDGDDYVDEGGRAEANEAEQLDNVLETCHSFAAKMRAALKCLVAPGAAAAPPLPQPLTKRGCSAPPGVMESCASQARRWGWGAVGVAWWERVLGSKRVEVPRARARGERRARAGLLDV